MARGTDPGQVAYNGLRRNVLMLNRSSAGSFALAVVLPLAAALSSGCDIITADLKHSVTGDWRKTYALDAGGRVEVANTNGRIRVTASGGNQVEIVAEKKARGASEESAKAALEGIQIQETVSGSSVRVETKLPKMGGMLGGSGEVTYTVRVPAEAEVKFTTVNGGIEISQLNGRIEAETTNGGITGRDVGGPIRASTTNGGVDVELTRVDKGGVTLGCTNGGIKLRLPANAQATISARISNGGIDAGGLALENVESTRNSLEARLNGGGPQIELSGTNGGIRIASR
jgi:hypothetical protein